MALKVRSNTALGCNHQSTCMPQNDTYSFFVQLVWYRCTILKIWRLGKACAVHQTSPHIGTYSRLEPGTCGSTVQRSDHYTTQGLINFKIHMARPAPTNRPDRNSIPTSKPFLKSNAQARVDPGIYFGGPTEFPNRKLRTMPESMGRSARDSF